MARVGGQIRLDSVTKQYGGRMVINDLTLDLTAGEIFGLVGPNGAGKTTLFKLIAGMIQPDIGAVTVSKGLQIGYLPQEPEVPLDRTLHDEVLSVFSDLLALEERMHALSADMATNPPADKLADLMTQYDRANDRFIAEGGYEYEQRLNQILGGLGFAPEDYKLPMTALSGGQRCRAALAKLLLDDGEYLLLDEPTNHLDIDAVRWLEKFLAGHQGGAIIISHDRYLLDRVAKHIIELENGKVYSYPGNYTNYVKTRDVRRLTQQRQYEKDKEFIEKERDYVARYLAGQRSSQAKGRRTRLERMLDAGEFVTDAPQDRRTMKLDFEGRNKQRFETGSRGDETLVAEGLSKRYGDKVLFNDFSLRVTAGMRVGITGPNGTGKSTLMKAMLQHIPADAGKTKIDSHAVIGYFAQDALGLQPERTILEEIREIRPDLTETQVRSILGGFLFSGEDSFKKIGVLSGGEQSRVRLVKLMLSGPTLLMLDEPTNHLDIGSREVLEEALADFPGTIITISHDRYFLDRIVDHLLVMRDGVQQFFRGNYSTYIEQYEQELTRNDASSKSARVAKESQGRAQPPKPPNKSPAAPRKKLGFNSPFAKMSVEELETLIQKREAQVRELNERYGDPNVYKDPAKLQQLQSELDERKRDLAAAEEAWGIKLETQ